jgi:fibronectin-binding autotransporter adhesin
LNGTSGLSIASGAVVNAGSGAASLTTGGSLAVNGGVTGGSATLNGTSGLLVASGALVNGGAGTASLTSAGTLTIGGNVTAASVALTGTAGIVFGVGGAVTDGGLAGDQVSLTSASGGISGATGTITARTLLVSAASSVDLSGPNKIQNLGSFTATSGSIVVNDGLPLTIASDFSGSGAVALSSSGLLTIGNGVTVAGTTLALTGAGISIGGTVTTTGGGGANSLSLSSSGTIDASGGVIQTGSLSGTAAAAITLSNTANAIGAVGPLTGIGITLSDGAPLTVTAATSVNAQTGAASLATTGLLTINGTVTGAAVGLSGRSGIVFGPTGLVNAGTNAVTLTSANGAITEGPGSGTIIAGTLTGSAGTSAVLDGAAAGTNQIGSIGSFTASAGSIEVRDGLPLTVTGSLSGSTGVTLTSTGLLTVAGGQTVSGPAIALTGSAISLPGTVTDGGSGSVALMATAGTINETGLLVAGTLSGSATGAVTLTGATPTTNQIKAIGSFTAPSMLINDGTDLAVTGSVNAGATATIIDSGTVTVPGTLVAHAIGVTAAAIGIGGQVSDGGGGSVTLVANGGTINETGQIIAGSLTGSSTGATRLVGPNNQVATLAGFNAAGFSLNDGVPLSITAPVISGNGITIVDTGALNVSPGASLTSAAGPITLQATGGITLPVSVTTPGSVFVSSGGSLSVTGSVNGATGVTLTALGSETLSGTIISTAGGIAVTSQGLVLGASNTLQASTLIRIIDTASINLGGVLIAPKIVIDDTGGTITVPSTGAEIVTAGSIRPIGTIFATSLPTALSSPVGAFMTTGLFQLAGTLNVTNTTLTPAPLGLTPALFRVDSSQGIDLGSGHFLNAPSTWMVAALLNGSKMKGWVDLYAFDLIFSGIGGSAAITGTIGGLTGVPAAGAAHIAPGAEVVFQVNGCPIGSVNCVLLPTQGIPAASPLRDIIFGSATIPSDEDDLLLPMVSDEVY